MATTTAIVAEWDDRPRTVEPRGYVLIRMAEHHRADVRGYVYEHVLVAEQILGRPLRPGERAQHRDAQPGNNDPANISVYTPPDMTIYVECACGCGSAMSKFDTSGRTRSFISGHNPQVAVTRDALLAALAKSPARCLSASELATTIGRGAQAAKVALSKLFVAGNVERPRVGYYRLPGSTATFPPLARKRPKSEWGSALSDRLKEQLLEDFGGRCGYGCGRRARVWDHLIPWSRGGTFRAAGNVVPACVPCNSAKNNSEPAEWIERAFRSDYAAEPMEGILDLAVYWGMATPEDFMTPAERREWGVEDEYPQMAEVQS